MLKKIISGFLLMMLMFSLTMPMVSAASINPVIKHFSTANTANSTNTTNATNATNPANVINATNTTNSTGGTNTTNTVNSTNFTNVTINGAVPRMSVLERLTGMSERNIVILMYHLISANNSELSDFCISPQNFENDIKYLAESGYTFCTASDIADYISGSKEINRSQKLIAITFDDGYSSDYVYALPVLEKYNAKATFFVFGKAIDTPGYLSKEQLKLLSQSPNAEIGNHSYAIHSKTIPEVKALYSDLNNVNSVVSDFMKNKELLEEIIGKEVNSLSYPNGAYNYLVDDELKKKGVKITFSTEERRELLTGNLTHPLGRYNRGINRDIYSIIR